MTIAIQWAPVAHTLEEDMARSTCLIPPGTSSSHRAITPTGEYWCYTSRPILQATAATEEMLMADWLIADAARQLLNAAPTRLPKPKVTFSKGSTLHPPRTIFVDSQRDIPCPKRCTQLSPASMQYGGLVLSLLLAPRKGKVLTLLQHHYPC